MEILPPVASRLLAVVLLFSVFTPALGQDAARKERERREKFETILRIQDSRSPVKGALQRALADADPLVRERAALACASLQDSSLLDLLTRLLEDPAVSPAAAFAIGQTGAALSPAGRERLENDLLWNRLRTTADVVSLLDGLGRFCTAAGLEEMLNKLDAAPDAPTTEGLLAALARSAVRGVTGDRAVRFLLRQTVPVERSSWVALYALQRTGPHPEILRQFDRLLPLRTHEDPLVRLNYAALLGKLAQARDVRPLLQMMGESDPDHRVRITALRSLAPVAEFDPDLFRRAILSSDQHIQVTALQGIAGSQWLAGARSTAALQLFDEVERAARNTGGGFHWQVQSEAAVALAKLRGIAVPLPQTEEFGPAELRILALTLPGDAVPVLAREARTGPPHSAVAALEELLALSRAHLADTSLRRDAAEAAAAALRRDDAAITATAAGVLTDSLLLTARTASLLLAALPEQNLSDDLEAILSIVDGLGATGDTRAIPSLMQLLRSPEPSVTRSSARALQRITGRPVVMPEPGSPLHTVYDFEHLWALPDTVRMTIETTRGWIPIELYPREAPFTVLNFISLATERNYFNGLTFHRVVPNFVVQGGDPRGDGWGGPGYTIRSEFPRRSYGRGSIGMASAGKDTEGSQFFITHSPQPHLDGRYTLFGQVASGLEVVDQLQIGDRIQSIRMGW